MGKESGKGYTYNWTSAVHPTPTQHCEATTPQYKVRKTRCKRNGEHAEWTRRTWPVHTVQWFGLKKENSSDGGCSGDEPWGRYAESNGSHRMTNALCYRRSWGHQIWRWKRRQVAARHWEERGMGNCCFKTQVLFYKMKRVTRMDSGNGCITMWIYLIPLNCTLKNS